MLMFKHITVQRLSVGSLFKLLAIGTSFSLVPFGLLMGVFALFGASTVHWNGQQLTGVAGLIASPFVGLFIALLLTVFAGATCALGLWLFSKLKPLELLAKEVTHGAATSQA
jgi:hypothetical protein